jgi:hypothetical protein
VRIRSKQFLQMVIRTNFRCRLVASLYFFLFLASISVSADMTWALNGSTTGGGGAHLGVNLKSATCPTAGTILYVDATAASGGNGSSWTCAFQSLQDAINAAASGYEIWVKAGTYKPTQDPFGNTSPADPRDKTFYLKNDVAVYGGFAGTETLRSQRNWTNNPTTLSGDIGTANDNSDNCHHVILSVSDASTTKLDGFTVTKGNGNGTSGITVETKSISRFQGGGMYNHTTSVTVTNCIFDLSTGTACGGMFNISTTGITVTNCVFSSNTSTSLGSASGAVYNSASSVTTFTNCTFLSNSGNTSGGMYNFSSSSPVVTNCTFFGNSSIGSGGAMTNLTGCNAVVTNCLFFGNYGVNGALHNGSCSPILTNCTISGNRTDNLSGSGGINNSSATPTLKNCIIWNNRVGTTTGSAAANMVNTSSTPTISYSLIQNHNPAGTGNLDGIPNAANSNYPGFVTPLDPAAAPSAAGDFHLSTCSPVLNLGTNSGAPTTDLFGNARPFGTTVDLGVHELQSAPSVPGITCPANQTGVTPYTLPDFTGLASTSGDCTPITITQSPTIGTSLAIGVHTITLTATDGNGATATCTFAVTVNSNCPATGSVWYVAGSAASGGTGTSWTCAFQNLQDAIDAAGSGHEIWVKAGTYKPTKDPFGNTLPRPTRATKHFT